MNKTMRLLPKFEVDPLVYVEGAARRVQHRFPHLGIKAGWVEAAETFVLELDDDALIRKGLLNDLLLQFFNELAAMGHPFSLGFGDASSPYLRLEEPLIVLPRLAQAA